MQDVIRFDHETASDLDLTKVGLDVYSSHPSTRMLMTAYRINKGPLQHWEAHKRAAPADLREAIEDPDVIKWGFNVQFERIICKRIMKLRTPVKNWRCSMTLAYMMSFNGRLEEVGQQIGLPLDFQKMKDGKRLINKFSMPQRLTKNQRHLWRNWETDEDDWELFCQYNRQDVIAEEAIEYRLGRFYTPEWRWTDYEMSEIINDRGIPVDEDFIRNVIWMSGRRKQELLDRLKVKTDLRNPNSVSQLLPWLQEHGYPFSDLRKHSVIKAISGKLGDIEAQRVMRLRQWASMTSVSKASKALTMLGDGGRLRFLFQFAGAGRTNRYAGRGVQSQNMKVTPKVLDAEEDDTKLSFATDLIRKGDYEGVELFIKEPMVVYSGCMRSMFRVEEDEEFQVSDLKSIESAVLAFITNCERLLGVFRDGKDPYKDFGTSFYKKPYDEITRPERTICKPPALGCGYRLSGGIILPDGSKTGLLAYAENMGVKLTQEEAHRAVQVFRDIYWEVPEYWKALEKASLRTVRTKEESTVGCVTFHWDKPFLLIRLPSGRDIFYYKPMIEPQVIRTGRMKKRKSRGLFEDGVELGGFVQYEETYVKQTVTYMGKDQKTGQWVRLNGHGGVFTENIDQAIAYDVLMVKLRRMEEEGYNTVMHAHDEGGAITRIGSNYHTVERLAEIFCEPVDWAPGLPLGASTWSGPFYRK